MKQHLLLFFILISSAVQAQDILTSGNKRQAESQQYRSVVVQFDGMDFDYRVLKHYSPEVLQSLTPEKRRQLYFLYTASYEVLNTSACPAFSHLDIDVAALERFRLDEATAELETGEACKVLVRLMSRSECRNKLDELIK